jgi:hypothetical protein
MPICILASALGKYTLTIFFSTIRVQISFSTCSGLEALLRFLAITTKQFFLAIIVAISFSLVGVDVIISPSATIANQRIRLRWSGEAATTNACSWSVFFRTYVISNSLLL